MSPAFVTAFFAWRDAPIDQRARLLRQQAADNAVMAAVRTIGRQCRELREAQIRPLIAFNGKRFDECGAQDFSEMLKWTKGLLDAANARAAVIPVFASATARRVKV
jgi:hypothetical protein